MASGYGKTQPVTTYCMTCNKQGQQRRRNKATEKSIWKKFCNSIVCRVVREFKPKVTKHSSGN